MGHALLELRETVAKEWLWVFDEVNRLLTELPPEDIRHLFELWKQIPDRRVRQAGVPSSLEQLCNLLICLSEHWTNYRVFGWQKDAP